MKLASTDDAAGEHVLARRAVASRRPQRDLLRTDAHEHRRRRRVRPVRRHRDRLPVQSTTTLVAGCGRRPARTGWTDRGSSRRTSCAGARRARRARPAARSRPPFITATVSAIVMASSWSWVTWTNVMPDLGLDPLELDLHLPAQLEVERAERLVEQQHLGPVDERPGQGDPLLLAAGELRRLACAPAAPARPARASRSTCCSTSLTPRRRRPKATFSKMSRCGNSA